MPLLYAARRHLAVTAWMHTILHQSCEGSNRRTSARHAKQNLPVMLLCCTSIGNGTDAANPDVLCMERVEEVCWQRACDGVGRLLSLRRRRLERWDEYWVEVLRRHEHHPGWLAASHQASAESQCSAIVGEGRRGECRRAGMRAADKRTDRLEQTSWQLCRRAQRALRRIHSTG